MGLVVGQVVQGVHQAATHDGAGDDAQDDEQEIVQAERREAGAPPAPVGEPGGQQDGQEDGGGHGQRGVGDIRTDRPAQVQDRVEIEADHPRRPPSRPAAPVQASTPGRAGPGRRLTAAPAVTRVRPPATSSVGHPGHGGEMPEARPPMGVEPANTVV